MKKKYMIVVVLLMLVGFAAVSTTLYLSGSTNIIGNKDDFKVYYSDVKVNGVQNLSIVESETSLVFSIELDTLGQTYVIEYDVTNSSKNYDADLTMVCTGGDAYLTVNNVFDDTTNLPATETRVGTLTLTLAKTYTGADYDVDIECTITANAVERSSLGTNEVLNPIQNPFVIGKEIVLAGEYFNVIEVKDNNVTLFASNVLDSDYKQTTTTDYDVYGVKFGLNAGWKYTPGPKDIDIQAWSTDFTAVYVNNYVSFLENELGIDILEGNLIALSQLKSLGCDVNDDYSYTSGVTCINSEYADDWLINGQYWWTRSAASYGYIWSVEKSGKVNYNYYNYADNGVRPIITISRDVLYFVLNNKSSEVNPQTFCESEGYAYGRTLDNGNIECASDSEFTDWSLYDSEGNWLSHALGGGV